MKLLVLAGTLREAQDYAGGRGLNSREWSFVGERSLLGVHGNDIVFVGTYWNRRDFLDIVDQMQVCELNRVNP